MPLALRPRGEDDGRPIDPEGFEGRLFQYVEWMRIHHYSEETVRARISQVRHFSEWCDARGLSRPTEVTKAILERYQAALFYYRTKDGRPLSLHSQRIALGDVRVFFKWLSRANLILYNPAADLLLPHAGHHLPKDVLSAEEAERVMAVPNVSTPVGLRDRAILETFYATGIRRIELVRLGLYDLDAKAGTIFIRQAKWRRERLVPLGTRALGWIERYLRDARPRLVVEPDPERVFLSVRGKILRLKDVTRLGRNYIERSGVEKGGSTHVFRHTCATLMLENGADLRFIQAMLGHASLQSTQVYTQVAVGKLKQVHAATHPGLRTPSPPSPEPGPPDSG